jgi:DNA-binding NtrC family response regulator
MAYQTFLLIYGKDPMLLRTRQWLLQSAGYQVETAETFAEVRKAAALHRVDLLILCHTLKPEDGESAAALVGGKWPESKCLALSSERDAPEIDPCGEWLRALEGPQRLMLKVKTLVGDGGAAVTA